MHPQLFGLLMITLASTCQAGETLHNGIVLPEQWPPKPATWPREAPVTPPYLASPPKVIPIDVGRQLFMDDFLIEKTDLKRTYHLAEYHEGNPVLKPETPGIELRRTSPFAMVFSDGVWWDPSDAIFKMWYLAGPFTCYATSRDGIRWVRPDLDAERKGTNIVKVPSIQRDSTCVWLDLEETDPSRRYKMSYFRVSQHILFSADGITWRNALPGDVGGGRGGLRTGDRSTMFYNPFRKVWVHSIRAGRNAAGGRCRYYQETQDLSARAFRSTADCSRWTCADSLDEPHPGYDIPTQLYNLDATPYESLMVGFFSVWHGDCQAEGLERNAKIQQDFDDGRPKINLVKLAFSRDGFHWYRPDRRAFLPVSEEKGAWNYGNVQSAGGGCLVVGDRLHFYCSGRAGATMPGSDDRNAGGSTGLAFLRRDGFASMGADADGGSLTTRPVTFRGRYLFVNVDSSEGELRAEVLGRDGKVVAPFSTANCKAVRQDGTLVRLDWQGAPDLSSLSGQPVVLRFHLKKGRLYAFWVSPDESGASYGYVAAGGPGFTSNRDTVGSQVKHPPDEADTE